MPILNSTPATEGDAILPKGPYQSGSSSSNVVRLDTSSDNAVWSVPEAWRGSMVRILSLGPQVQVLFSDQEAPEVEYSTAATAGGTKVGKTIPALQELQVFIPASAVAMAHEAASAGVIELMLG